ncbi:MAG: alpha/beta fold hydrolase [Alphaproteobacteria bacterium]
MKQNLILIPGLLNDERLWRHQIQFFENDYNIIVPKIKGHTHISAMAREIIENAPESFALAGLSMGGYIAMEMLRQASSRINKVAFLDTSWLADDENRQKDRHRLMDLSEMGRFEGVTDLLLKQIVAKENLDNPAITNVIKTMAKETGQKEFINQQKLILSRPDSVRDFSSIRVPALCLVGREDKLTPPHILKEMSAALKEGIYCEIEGAGHLPPLEQPIAVTAAMQVWLGL